ncbi:MAG: ribosomal protein S18-alanine N-acetyltransferase [Erysipelotrichaceae bacterium]|nr:ribosomal protein S18-alanine N-acetyltransferase [Erysipelotrichaceae bacterium]
MILREMTYDDLSTIATLEAELFKEPWSQSDFQRELDENEFANYYIAEIDGEVAGYFGLWLLFDQAQITTIGTAKKFQRQHVASFMMEAIDHMCAENECEFLSLEVRVINIPAQNLYKKFGLEIVSVRKDYYGDHENAYLMVKAVGGFE